MVYLDMVDPELNWDQLQSNPKKFFGLQDDYDLKDLKRAYNALIRVYKPEQYPNEFQKIRSAYEPMLAALKYGIENRESRTVDFHIKKSGSIETFEALESTEKLELLKRLDVESVDSIYKSLSKKTKKSPEEFVRFAMFADFGSTGYPNRNERFFDCLVEGLKAHPNHNGLVEMCRELLNQMNGDEFLLDAMIRLSKSVSPSTFSYITEQSWIRLIAKIEFDQFKEGFQKSVNNLTISSELEILPLYTSIAKSGIWFAEQTWIDNLIGAIEDQYFQLDYWMQSQFEMLDYLNRYHKDRDSLVDQKPICTRIDAAIRSWCVDAEWIADQNIVECQLYIAANPDKVISEFPMEGDLQNLILNCWQYVSEDVEERLGEPKVSNSEEVNGDAELLAARCERRLHYKSALVLFKFITKFFIIGGLLIWLVVCAIAGFLKLQMSLAVGTFGSDLLFSLGILFTTTVGVLSLFGLILYLVGRPIKYHLIRGELMRFFRSHPLTVQELARILRLTQDNKIRFAGERWSIKLYKSDEMADKMLADTGLKIYALAQRLISASALAD